MHNDEVSAACSPDRHRSSTELGTFSAAIVTDFWPGLLPCIADCVHPGGCAMDFEPSKVTELTQELRLATTMTGGVSLAIWMAGVTREINLLSQASQWRRAGGAFPSDSRLSQDSAASLTLYTKLIDLLDTIVDVDTLSGTSAGGINAALLAWSRVTGTDLGELRNLWLDLGDLTTLLRNPTAKTTPSLLYGDEKMYAELAQHVPTLKVRPFPPKPLKPGQPPHICQTTVYITTTLLTGEESRFTDAYGTTVQDVDRRGLFTFNEQQLANRANMSALTLAARSSASFPLAFEPSFIPFTEGTPQMGKVPARPPMADFTDITRPHWVADGGLLDNRPIDVLLERIFDRPARRQVRRVLLFVVPSTGPAPDLTKEAPVDNVNEPLGLVPALLKDLSAVTTQSIATDLGAICDHQDRMEARTDARLHLAQLATALPQGSRLLMPSLLKGYGKQEATKQARDLTTALLRQLSTWPPSTTSGEGIPPAWEKELHIGGGVEAVCRQPIVDAILGHWPDPDAGLPETPADLAHYGLAAYDLAKACALAVLRPAYQLARTEDDITALTGLTAGIHNAADQTEPSDPDEPQSANSVELVRNVCAVPSNREGSLANLAAQLAQDHLEQSGVSADSWDKLGQVFVTGYPILRQLVASGSTDSEAPTGSMNEKTHTAAGQLTTYLDYLSPATDAQAVARKLFDLAATQRAMLPAGADVEQFVELVQVSADTRSLLAPGWDTAQQKLTGMQFHHFGAFYKESWRANDWMWGRLDGAGWLVHLLLDPRRVRWIAEHRAHDLQRGPDGPETGAQWFVRKLKELGAPEFPSAGYALSDDTNGSGPRLTEDTVINELDFLDDPKKAIPSSIPMTSLWLAQLWQQRILDEELDELAGCVIHPDEKRDWSPATSQAWAKRVRAAPKGDAKYAFLQTDPIATETFLTDKRSPLMANTITKAAATASGAASSIRELPGVVKPPVNVLRTVALGGYRVSSMTGGVAKWTVLAGALLVLVGVFTSQSGGLFGVGGLAIAAMGAYLIVLGTWQLSSGLLYALLSLTLVLAVVAPTLPCVRGWLFGAKGETGWVGKNVHWFGTQWWHPLILVAVVAIAALLAWIESARLHRTLRNRKAIHPSGQT
jgi:patatin-related protein